MAKKAEFNIEIRAKELGLDLQDLAAESEQALKDAIAEVAEATYANIVAKAQKELHRTRQDYLSGLSFAKIGPDSYLISLDTNWANMLESGYSGAQMKEILLSSTRIVQQGSRTGLPWVRTAKDGHKYAAVPFEHKSSTQAPPGADLAQALRSLKATNSEGKLQSITKVFKDINGRAIDSGAGAQSRAVARVKDVSGLSPEVGKLLDGLVKYQRVVQDSNGKEKVLSIYHTYRMISEAGKTWNGYEGLHAFEDAEKFVAEQIDKILKSFT